MCWKNLGRFGGKECELGMIMTCFLMYTAFKRQIKWIILIVFYYMFEKFLIHMNISTCQNSKICWLIVTWGHAKSPLFMPTNTVLSLLAFILINLSNICFRKFQYSLHWKCIGDKLLWERLWVRYQSNDKHFIHSASGNKS